MLLSLLEPLLQHRGTEDTEDHRENRKPTIDETADVHLLGAQDR
jgi:hypothetical protein